MLSQVKEQDEAVAYLRKVVEGRFTSPLLLVGDEGVGRRFSCLQAAKESFSGGDPSSNFCLQVDQRTHPDFSLVVPDGDKDIGIDAIRDVIQTAYDFPMISPRRYYVIDGVDRMTPPAANAFLKTLEEPPKFTQFFLLAESAEAVIPTIRSRCGKVRYKRLSEELVANSISEFVSDPLIRRVYARLAEGSVGRAVQYFGSNRLQLRDRAFSLLKTGISKDLSLIFSAVDGFEKDLKLGLRFFEHVLYDLTMLPHDPARIANLDLAEELGAVRKQLGEARIRAVHLALRTVQGRMQATKINLAFHVKAALGTAFTE